MQNQWLIKITHDSYRYAAALVVTDLADKMTHDEISMA